ncbi:MAG: site-specific integrase [Phycisphaeraceae bacterium]|nr:site-specific integrase [Phycisphaeraceae bacterium]
MPRLKTRTPRIYRDRDYAYVKLDGQRVPLGRWGTAEAQEAYDRLIAEWLANGRKVPAPTVETEPQTVTEVLVAYTRHVDQRYGSTKAPTIRVVFRLARQLYGSEPAEAFGPKRLRVVRDSMIAAGLARSTINERIGWLVRAFKWAASHELCSERIYRRLATVQGLRRGEGGKETAKIKPVPCEDIRRVRRRMARPVRGLIDLQLLTGARPGELLNLSATDIDRSGSGEVWTYKLVQHKAARFDKERTIYFGPRAQRILQQFMPPGRAIDKPLFSPRDAFAEAMRRRCTIGKGRRPNQKANPVTTGRSIGDAYTTASYRRAINYGCKAAGVPDFGPHRLRHNAATFLRRQFGLDVASVILGHSTLAVTATYAELNDKKAREVIACVG